MQIAHYMTSFGAGTVYATEAGVVQVEIPDLTDGNIYAMHVVQGSTPPDIAATAADLLQRYFQGERVDFSHIPVDLSGLTPFRQKVLKAIRALGYGEISTYCQIAGMCDSPRAARAVGGALAANPVPVIIPCHRVIASNGCLTGFSAPGGTGTKKAMLLMEGINFNGSLVVKNQQVIHSISNR